MTVNFNILKNFTPINTLTSNTKQLSFKAEPQQDTFEKSNKEKIIKLYVFNPFSNIFYNVQTPVALSKKQKFTLTSNQKCFLGKTFVVEYDPDNYDYIFDKKSNRREKVMILTGHYDKKPDEISFHFMSKDLSKEYGYVHLSRHLDPKTDIRNNHFIDEELFRNYPAYKIAGPRVFVEYLKNWNPAQKGGIGKLADKLAVKYCLDNNIKPVIVSNADRGSHVAHYLRGKRFLPPEKDSSSYNYLKERYGCTNLNRILQKLVKESEIEGERIDLGDLGIFPMYMPEELAKKYEEELKSVRK